MAANTPLTPEELQKVRDLNAKGLSCSAVARELGRVPSTISRAAARMGLTWDRAKTQAATHAKVVNNKARRAAIIGRLYARAEHLLDRLEAPEFKFTATSVHGIETKHLDHIPGQEEKALAGALASHLQQAVRLEAVDSDNGAEDAKSMLAALAAGLQAAYEQLGPADDQP